MTNEVLDGALDEQQVPDGEGEALPADAYEELTAVAEAEADALTEAQAALETERAQTRTVLERYRAAALAAEPELPPDLVRGDRLEELEASLAGARAAVAEVRTRLEAAGAQAGERGFPAGAPPRGETGATVGMSAAEKIRAGLEQRARE